VIPQMLIKVGSRYPWGDQAVLFTRVWQEFMGMMRPETRAAVKMEWAPNAVPDCEWRPADYDPYLPFWPGDDMVDIVGMSIYFYGTEDHVSYWNHSRASFRACQADGHFSTDHQRNRAGRHSLELDGRHLKVQQLSPDL